MYHLTMALSHIQGWDPSDGSETRLTMVCGRHDMELVRGAHLKDGLTSWLQGFYLITPRFSAHFAAHD